MSEQPRSSQQKLAELTKALDAHDGQRPTPATRPRRSPAARPEIGPKTRLSLQIMRWGLTIFWLLWLLLAWFSAQPHSIVDVLIIPFSGAIVWIWYQVHKSILIWSVQKGSARFRPSQDDR